MDNGLFKREKVYDPERKRKVVYYSVPLEHHNYVAVIKSGREYLASIKNQRLVLSSEIESDVSLHPDDPSLYVDSIDSWFQQSRSMNFPLPTISTLFLGEEFRKKASFNFYKKVFHEKLSKTEKKTKSDFIHFFIEGAVKAFFPKFLYELIKSYSNANFESILSLDKLLDFNIVFTLQYNNNYFSELTSDDKERYRHRLIAYLLLDLTKTDPVFDDKILSLLISSKIIKRREDLELVDLLFDNTKEDQKNDGKRKYILQKCAWNNLVKGNWIKGLHDDLKDFDVFVKYLETAP